MLTPKDASEDNNFLFLAIGIVALLFVAALIEQFPGLPGKAFIEAFSLFNIVIGIYGFKASATWVRTVPGLALLFTLSAGFTLLLRHIGTPYLHLLILSGFYLWALWLASKEVFLRKRVDFNRITGAVCIYLLLGVIWTLLYLFITLIDAHAFNGLTQRHWYENFADLAYYSFVTMTTLGYGDITPVAPLAKFLAYMEAIVSAFYMTILVASLVGLGINEVTRKRED